MNSVDKQYTDLLKDILENGIQKETRSGLVRSVFSRTMRFNLKDGLPLLTTKKVFYRGVIEELLWFISGSTNIKPLFEKNVHIWDDDAYRYYKELIKKHNDIIRSKYNKELSCYDFEETFDMKLTVNKKLFLEKVKNGDTLSLLYSKDGYCRTYTYGDLGAMYGKNWRNFGYQGKDQIKEIIDLLKNDPNNRRILLTCYDPNSVDEAALYPCHIMYQFYCKEIPYEYRLSEYVEKTDAINNLIDNGVIPTEKDFDDAGIPKYSLSCSFICRSQDVPLGTPFNIASAAFLTYMLAEVCNMLPDELIWIGQDCHIYENQIEGVKEQLKRNGSYTLPSLSFKRNIKNIDDFTYDDFVIKNYNPDQPIKFPLSVG